MNESEYICECISLKNHSTILATTADLNWKVIARLCHLYQVAEHIYKQCPHSIPPPWIQHFKTTYLRTAATNEKLLGELTQINNTFATEGIKCIPLKGLVFAHQLYNDSNTRRIYDLDILIAKDDISRSKKLLAQNGYQLLLNGRPESYWLRYLHHLTFRHPEKSIPLELHWAFSPPRPKQLNITSAWQRAASVSIAGTNILSLSPEDMLLSACLEMCKIIGNIQRPLLKNIVDVDRLIVRYGSNFDVDYIARMAAEWDVRDALRYLLLLTSKHLQTRWPQSLCAILSQRKKAPLITMYAQRIGFRSRFSAYVFLFMSTNGLRNKLLLVYQRLQSYVVLVCLCLRDAARKTRIKKSGSPTR